MFVVNQSNESVAIILILLKCTRDLVASVERYFLMWLIYRKQDLLMELFLHVEFRVQGSTIIYTWLFDVGFTKSVRRFLWDNKTITVLTVLGFSILSSRPQCHSSSSPHADCLCVSDITRGLEIKIMLWVVSVEMTIKRWFLQI